MVCKALEELLSGRSFLCLLVKGHLQQSSPEVTVTHGAAGTLSQRKVRSRGPHTERQTQAMVASAKHVTMDARSLKLLKNQETQSNQGEIL